MRKFRKLLATISLATISTISCSDEMITQEKFCDFIGEEKCDLPFEWSDDMHVVNDSLPYSEDRFNRFKGQALAYMNQVMKYETAINYDEYDIAAEIRDYKFYSQNDSLLFHQALLAAMCNIQKAVNKGYLGEEFDVQEDIQIAWNAFKEHQVHSSGTWIRHPNFKSNTSISRDGISGVLFLAAVAKNSNCQPIVNEFGKILSDFKRYGQSKDWEYGLDGFQSYSTSNLRERQPLKMALNIYGQDYSDMDLANSIYAPYSSTYQAPIQFSNAMKCSMGFPGACLRVGGSSAVFPLHLTMMTTYVAAIDSLTSNPHLSNSEVKKYFRYLQAVGSDVGYENWYFITVSRFINQENSYNDVMEFFLTHFPANHIPTKTCTKEYMVHYPEYNQYIQTDFLWQRVPTSEIKIPGNCVNENPLRHTMFGTDLLLPFSFIVLGVNNDFN